MAGPFRIRDDPYDRGGAGVALFSLRSGALLTWTFFADVAFYAGSAFFGVVAFFIDLLAGVAFFALIAAHLFRCASAIRFLASTLSFGFVGILAGAVASFAGVTAGTFSAFFVIQRLRCASAIRARAALLSFRLVVGLETEVDTWLPLTA